MAELKKLSKRPSLRDNIERNLVTTLLWKGKVETTFARAKNVARITEKLLTKAINTYTDSVKVTKTVMVDGVATKKEVINDGPKKLNARRALMAYLYDAQELRGAKESKGDFIERTKDIKHPLLEKIFNVYAPKYAERKQEVGQGGGYTRIVKTGPRRGDGAEGAIVSLV
ncbi:MAG: L17 family ribosomal protein [Clostridia bacterium]|nr:L17 family ribosomal protein [Clostridia bacterium]